MKKQAHSGKNLIPVVILGEKDHGKSTLLGRLFYETKNFPEDRLREIKKTMKVAERHFEWAHLLDSFRYERENEMTLDTSHRILEIGRNAYEFIDVPGHRELINNMLSGASRAEHAILVVAADEGIKPQTILHLEIARFIGISRIIAVINKCDRIGYSQGKFKLAEKQLAGTLLKCGFKNARILPMVAKTGDNLLYRTRRLAWFRGPTLLGAIKNIFHAPASPAKKQSSALFAVQDVYQNDMIIGRVIRGALVVGRKLKKVQGEESYRIQNIFINNQKKKKALAGDNAGIILAPSPLRIKRGNLLAAKKLPLPLNILANCIFIKKPAGYRVFVESEFQESAAKLKILSKPFLLGKPLRTDVWLKKKLVLPDKFVIKKGGAIIGLGRVLSTSGKRA